MYVAAMFLCLWSLSPPIWTLFFACTTKNTGKTTSKSLRQRVGQESNIFSGGASSYYERNLQISVVVKNNFCGATRQLFHFCFYRHKSSMHGVVVWDNNKKGTKNQIMEPKHPRLFLFWRARTRYGVYTKMKHPSQARSHLRPCALLPAIV